MTFGGGPALLPLLYDAPGCSDGEVGEVGEGSSVGDGVGNCGAFAVKTDGGGGGSPLVILAASRALALSSHSATQSLFMSKMALIGGNLKNAVTIFLPSSDD